MADTILTSMQKVVLDRFVDHTKGLTVEDVCKGSEGDLALPVNDVRTTLPELEVLEFVRRDPDDSKWFITYAGMRAKGTADYPWP
jgi:DNA-binding IclR family transcriptional regulator